MKVQDTSAPADVTPCDPAIDEMRARARAYPSGSPEREAFHVALVRRDYAEIDARVDAAIMRSWRIRGAA